MITKCNTDLLPCDGHIISDIGEDRGLDEVALVAMAPTANLHLGALLFALVYHVQDLLELLLVDLGKDTDLSVYSRVGKY